ncbi:uncharacterized protein RAG0_06217 [Rhynchosporium agropyri]|uniref:Uncharacterized protein n=1 Tax=Rhynchosporium agropyri TaxID=914238 RepID=A0A1E1KGC3_9HELO|nr:uncharacterized protein RAG0_06217 [Rhynchosporium agropyri]
MRSQDPESLRSTGNSQSGDGESREVFKRELQRFLEVTGKVEERVDGQGQDDDDDNENDDENEDASEQQEVEDEDGKGDNVINELNEDENEKDIAEGDSGNEEEGEDEEPSQIDKEEAAAAEAEYWAENPRVDPETGEPYLPAPIPGSVTYINPFIDTLYICANGQSEISIRPQSMNSLASMECLATLKRLACVATEVCFGVVDGGPQDDSIMTFLPGLTSIVVTMGDICWNEMEHELDERSMCEVEFTETVMCAKKEADRERRIDGACKLFVQSDRWHEVVCSMKRVLRGGEMMEYLDQ